MSDFSSMTERGLYEYLKEEAGMKEEDAQALLSKFSILKKHCFGGFLLLFN